MNKGRKPSNNYRSVDQLLRRLKRKRAVIIISSVS
jgi:hypothetical protein